MTAGQLHHFVRHSVKKNGADLSTLNVKWNANMGSLSLYISLSVWMMGRTFSNDKSFCSSSTLRR